MLSKLVDILVCHSGIRPLTCDKVSVQSKPFKKNYAQLNFDAKIHLFLGKFSWHFLKGNSKIALISTVFKVMTWNFKTMSRGYVLKSGLSFNSIEAIGKKLQTNKFEAKFIFLIQQFFWSFFFSFFIDFSPLSFKQFFEKTVVNLLFLGIRF